jgi:hypothetical protein
MNYMNPFAFSVQRWYNADAPENRLAYPELNLARTVQMLEGSGFNVKIGG